MENKNNKTLFTVLGIVAGLLLLTLFLFLYFRTTPQYSLMQIRKSVQDRDYALFEKYVDVNSVVDNVFTEAMKDTNPEEAGMFAGLITNLVESAKSTAKTSFRTSIENGESETSQFSEMTSINLLTKVKIEKHGKTADVKLNNNSGEFSFSMRNENGLWRIFKINNMKEILEKEKTEETPSNTIEKALKDEVTLATITIKVNKAEKLSKLPSSFGDPTKPSNKDNVFLKLNLTIKNTSNEDITVGNDMIVVADSENNQYEMQSLYFLADNKSLQYESIKSNLAKTGNVYFEVPKTATGFYLPIKHKDTNDLYKIILGL